MNLERLIKSEDFGFLSTRLVEEDTGINAIIWCCVGLCFKDGISFDKDDEPMIIVGEGYFHYKVVSAVAISIEDDPRVLAPKNPKLGTGTIKAVMKWIAINKDLLLEYWNDPLFYTKRLYTEAKKV